MPWPPGARKRPTLDQRPHEPWRRPNGVDVPALEAALKRIAPTVYVPALTGRDPDPAGKIACPFHEDRHPSLHVYESAERGWTCYQCNTGGSIVDLGARLYGLHHRGADYPVLLRRIAEELLGGAL